jgi:C-terminal processing protease CtpA/Prc
MKNRFVLILVLASMAGARATAEDAAPVQMAPVTVKAGALGFIGVRLSVSTGMLGLISTNAPITELVIVEVLRDSAAQRAGLVAQDRILQIDGVPITKYSINGLREMGDREKGDTIEFVVRSPESKAPRTVQVTLGARKIAPR